MMLLVRLQDPRDYRKVAIMELARKVGKAVRSIWMNCNSKLVGAVLKENEVVRRVFMLWNRMEEVASGGKKKANKKGKRRSKYGSATKEREEFFKDLDQLFDILSCTCPIKTCAESSCSSSCTLRFHIKCSCPMESKIPYLELEFIYDQRTKTGVKGKLQIAGKDTVESARQRKAEQRDILEKQRVLEREEREAAKEEELFGRHREQEKLMQEWGDMEPDLPSNSGDNKTTNNNWINQQNRSHIPRTVMASMRGGVSQRTLANILSSYAVDMGLATREDPSLLVDQAKVAREMAREMARVTKNAEAWMRTSGIDAIQFDGKEEKAKARVKLEDGTEVIRHIKEDHITLTDCQGVFLMHFTKAPVEGVRAGKVIALRIAAFLESYGINSTIRMIGADSTNTNVGHMNGAIALLEKQLGKRLLWSICLLHTNELPLRHLIEKLDGPTGSGNTLTGPAGRLLPITQSLPYNSKFTPLSCGDPLVSLPPMVLADLSWDQQYGYKMILALEFGTVPRSLQVMVIGPVNHSRWLTTANRFLDLWTRDHGLVGNDLENLKQICLFILGVYYKQWFSIKRKHKLVDGPRHMLRQVQLVKEHCSPEVRKVVDPYVSRSSYFAHPELILTTLLASEDEKERQFGVTKILQIIRKGSETGDSKPRQFKAPPVNFEARNLPQLIDWEKVKLSEPLVTATMSSQEVVACLDSPLLVPATWQCHSQSMERAIRKVSEASLMVVGEEKREGWIRCAEESRKVLKKPDSKVDYKSLFDFPLD